MEIISFCCDSLTGLWHFVACGWSRKKALDKKLKNCNHPARTGGALNGRTSNLEFRIYYQILKVLSIGINIVIMPSSPSAVHVTSKGTFYILAIVISILLTSRKTKVQVLFSIKCHHSSWLDLCSVFTQHCLSGFITVH